MSEKVQKNTCPKCGTTLIMKRSGDYGCTICQHSFKIPDTKTVYVPTVGIGIREYEHRKKITRMKYELSQDPTCTKQQMKMRTGYGMWIIRRFYKECKTIFMYAGVE